MEFKHFSHIHGLVFHPMPHGSEIHCSGCKFPGSGNVYACWQCNYFLHEQCFRAARSLRLPSHPLHPLTLVPVPTYPSGSFFCNTCNIGGDGFSYSCSSCEFDIHVHCALMPNNANPHLPPSPVPGPNFSFPNPAQNSNPQPQNPMYPPPIQSNAFPTYPPQNATQNYPPQTQNPTYPPIPNNPYPNFNPPNSLPQTTPQVPQNNPYPNFTPPNNNLPQTSPQVPQNPAYQPNQNNPVTAYPQQTPTPQNFAPPANPTVANQPPPPPQPQPNQPVPTYSTVVNATTTNPPQPPPASQPNTTTTVPQPKPPTIIKHFSHPHVLKAMELEQKNGKICSACECELSGLAYYCTESYCTFNLHSACFDAPRETRHNSHLQHPLTLLTTPPYEDGFTCNACLKEGKAFVYHCKPCGFDLHVDCIQWPDTVTRPDHSHALRLYYSSPATEGDQTVVFECDVCSNPIHEMAWMYYCRDCDFGTHLECITSGIKPQNTGGSGGGAGAGGGGEQTEEELIREMELKFAVLQLLLGAQGRGNAGS